MWRQLDWSKKHGCAYWVQELYASRSTYLDVVHDFIADLLLAAGEATWTGGPLGKGLNLCHDTGGNGYALLVLYRGTGDRRWLDRARVFAMQCETALGMLFWFAVTHVCAE